MRTCPFKGCGKSIAPHLFACFAHWKLIRPPLQREIHAVYDGWKQGEVDSDELRERQQAVLDQTPPGGTA
jgi:hypothetical protein